MSDSTTLIDGIVQGSGSQDLQANAVFDAASPAMLYGRQASTSSGDVWGYYGGNVTLSDGTQTTKSNGTLSLTASVINYIVAQKSDGAVSSSTGTTNWNDRANYWRLYIRNADGTWTDEREIGRMTGLGTGLVAPVTKTADFTLGANENEVICNGSASITVTLPAASGWCVRKVRLKTIAAYTVVSASSNVVPLTGGAAGTAILAATAGKWVELVSDGTNWIIMAGN
jgi:hypothetical protein